MAPMDEMILQPDQVELIVLILLPQGLQQLHLRLSLQHKGLPALDNLDGHLSSCRSVNPSHDLPKAPLPNPVFQQVSVLKHLVPFKDVIVIFVIPPIVVDPSLHSWCHRSSGRGDGGLGV